MDMDWYVNGRDMAWTSRGFEEYSGILAEAVEAFVESLDCEDRDDWRVAWTSSTR
jgi:hypothetical protein